MDDERIFGEPCPKVGDEQIGNVIVGFNGRVERAAFRFHKAHEAVESVDFVAHFFDALNGGEHVGLGKPFANWAFVLCKQAKIAEGDLFVALLPTTKERIQIF